MNVEHLVEMANDIANFFHGEVGRENAPASIATHIQRYWDPRMRAAIIAHAKSGGEHMQPTVLAAVKSLPQPPVR